MPQFKLPDPGEGLVEAEIVTWKVKPGDAVKVNDVVVEIETAKSLVELPIPWAGTVKELLVAEGETVVVGTPIIDVTTDADVTTDGPDPDDDHAGSDHDSDTDADVTTDGPDPDDDHAGSDHDSDTDDDHAGSEDGSDPEDSGRQEAAPDSAGAVVSDDQADDLVPGTGAEPVDNDPPPTGGRPQREAVLVGYGASEGATTRRRRRHGGRPEAAEAPAPRVPVLAKPPVRKYAKDRGVDLAQVVPTREDGVVTRADVDAHLAATPPDASAGAGTTPPDAPAGAATTPPDAPAGAGTTPPDAPAGRSTPAPFDRSGERATRTPVRGVRKVTAQAMRTSAFTAPHVTEFLTVDATATMELVERLKQDREFRDLKVNPLLVLAKALCLAVRRHPGMNAVWESGPDGDVVVQRHYVNLGIAAATPRGLIVPTIKDADLMDLRQLAEAMAELVATARAGRTQPAQMSGGTITITNVGVFGVDTGTPIINPGESAIVAFGAVRRQPWVVTAADGTETIAPRWVTQLAVSFDHRLIDGELGSRFLADLGALLEDPARALVWG